MVHPAPRRLKGVRRAIAAGFLLGGVAILGCDVRIPEEKRPHRAGATATPGSPHAAPAPHVTPAATPAPPTGTPGTPATTAASPAPSPVQTPAPPTPAPAPEATPSPTLAAVPYGAGKVILPGTICGAIAWGGIVPGITEDGDLMTLFGPGLLERRNGSGGARFYTDRGGTLTVRFALSAGGTVTAIDIDRGFAPPSGATPEARRWMTSPRIRPGSGAYGPDVRLGSEPAALVKVAGAPRRRVASQGGKIETWTYAGGGGAGACEDGPEVLFRFEEGRLTRVTYRAGR